MENTTDREDFLKRIHTDKEAMEANSALGIKVDEHLAVSLAAIKLVSVAITDCSDIAAYKDAVRTTLLEVEGRLQSILDAHEIAKTAELRAAVFNRAE